MEYARGRGRLCVGEVGGGKRPTPADARIERRNQWTHLLLPWITDRRSICPIDFPFFFKRFDFGKDSFSSFSSDPETKDASVAAPRRIYTIITIKGSCRRTGKKLNFDDEGC